MNPARLKVLFVGLIVIIMGSVLLLFYDFPKKIDLTYPAIELQPSTTQSSKETTLNIKGTLKRPFLRNSIFKGSVTVDNYDYTKTYDLIDFPILETGDQRYSVLSYTTVLTDPDTNEVYSDLISLGIIYIDGNFDHVGIRANGPINEEKSESINRWIVAPAENEEEATLLYQSFMEGD